MMFVIFKTSIVHVLFEIVFCKTLFFLYNEYTPATPQALGKRGGRRIYFNRRVPGWLLIAADA